MPFRQGFLRLLSLLLAPLAANISFAAPALKSGTPRPGVRTTTGVSAVPSVHYLLNAPLQKSSLSAVLHPPNPVPSPVPEAPAIAPSAVDFALPAPEANGENIEAQTKSGRALFDHGGRGLWGGIKDWLSGVPAPAPEAPPVKSLESRGGQVFINGLPAKRLGFGSFKDVFQHPQDGDFVVKVFQDVSSRHSGLDEKRLEAENIRLLEKLGATPRLAGQGALSYKGKTAGFIVTERVLGADLRVMSAEKRRLVKNLFDELIAAGLEIADADRPLKLRQNIMTGAIGRAPPRAYLVDADFSVTKKGPRELRAFYENILGSL